MREQGFFNRGVPISENDKTTHNTDDTFEIGHAQSKIKILTESKEEARSAAIAKLDHLESLLQLPARIWDGFMEEEYCNVWRKTTFSQWDVPNDYKYDQEVILEKLLYFGAPLLPGYTYPDKDDELISDPSQPYGFYCSINRGEDFRRNVYIEYSGRRIKIPIISRSDKPYTLAKEYTPEEIAIFMERGDKSPEIEMDPSVPYTLERAETDIINTDLR